jgi:hypothetical protein
LTSTSATSSSSLPSVIVGRFAASGFEPLVMSVVIVGAPWSSSAP